MRKNYQSLIALLICLFVVVFGTAGYVLIENYSPEDAFYMTMITITTVGYGEVIPLSDSGRAFTSLLIIMGFVGLAYAGRIFVESIFENISSGRLEAKKMHNQITKLKNHFIICGFGRVGSITANYLMNAGHSFVVLDPDPKTHEELKEKGILHITGDATHEDELIKAGIKKAKGLLALLDSDPGNLFVVLTARELNPTLHIIARVRDKAAESKIYKGGADGVVSPFVSAGNQIAEDLLMATGYTDKILDKQVTRNLSVSPEWIDIKEGSSMCGTELKEISRKMNLSIVGLRRNDCDYLSPDRNFMTLPGDRLFVLDQSEKTSSQIVKLKKEDPVKLVIVDDNPIILRLFGRLFQKAGFVPLTAKDGQEGFDLIMKEKPDVAVIDYMLPVMSGIEVCKKIKKEMTGDPIKLVLFTADEKSATQEQALKAGADKVIVKSPDSSEIVSTVKDLMRISKE